MKLKVSNKHARKDIILALKEADKGTFKIMSFANVDDLILMAEKFAKRRRS
jgi:hypothetical protein